MFAYARTGRRRKKGLTKKKKKAKKKKEERKIGVGIGIGRGKGRGVRNTRHHRRGVDGPESVRVGGLVGCRMDA